MSTRVSAGLLLFRRRPEGLEVLLAHPGGPLFAHKDSGHWTVPKGEVEPGEPFLEAARREVREEVGIEVAATSRFVELGSIRQKGGKIVHAWAVESDWDDTQPIRSNLIEMEWPPGSGRQECFPEVDQARFFSLPEARRKLKASQEPFLDRLAALLGVAP